MKPGQSTRVAQAAGIVMLATVASRILGYVREVVIYALFGQNRLTDAYNAAFSIPDFLYMLLVGGALSSAFIPVFSSYIATDRENEAWEVASTILNILLILLALGIAVGMIFTPQLIVLLVPGFDPATLDLTVILTRIMFFQVIFMVLSGIIMAILNSYRNFLYPALGSVLYNFGIITVGWLFSPYIGIAGFSIGVVAGAAMQVLVQLPALLRLGVVYTPRINWRHPGVRKVGQLIFPVLIGLSVTQLNLFVNQNLASHLSGGLVAALRTAQRLMQLPIGIFAISVAVAAFPTMTAQVARGETNEFKRTLSLSLRSVLYVSLPAAAGLIALRIPIIRLLFEQGKFTADATQATADALFFYSLGLFAYGATQVLNRAFYSLHDTRTPVTVGIVTIALNIVLNILLIRYLQHGGLALAYSVAGIFNLLLLLGLLRRETGPLGGAVIVRSFSQSLLASIIMGVVVAWVASFLGAEVGVSTKAGQAIQVLGAMGAGVGIYGLVTLALRMQEPQLVIDMVKERLGRHRPR